MEEYRSAAAFTVPGLLKRHPPLYVANLPVQVIRSRIVPMAANLTVRMEGTEAHHAGDQADSGDGES